MQILAILLGKDFNSRLNREKIKNCSVFQVALKGTELGNGYYKKMERALGLLQVNKRPALRR